MRASLGCLAGLGDMDESSILDVVAVTAEKLGFAVFENVSGYRIGRIDDSARYRWPYECN